MSRHFVKSAFIDPFSYRLSGSAGNTHTTTAEQIALANGRERQFLADTTRPILLILPTRRVSAEDAIAAGQSRIAAVINSIMVPFDDVAGDDDRNNN